MALCGNMTRSKQKQEFDSGSQLRQLRNERGLTLRDVERASLRIAQTKAEQKNDHSAKPTFGCGAARNRSEYQSHRHAFEDL